MYSPVRGSNAILFLAVLVVANVGASAVHIGPGWLDRTIAPAALQPELAAAHPLRVRTWASLDDSQEAIDAGGIVAFDFGHGIALGQHNHLGGTRNIAARPVGSFVRVSGAGRIDGTYRVAENVRTLDMDDDDLGRIARGRLVAYTCVGRADDDVRQVIALEPVESPSPDHATRPLPRLGSQPCRPNPTSSSSLVPAFPAWASPSRCGAPVLTTS